MAERWGLRILGALWLSLRMMANGASEVVRDGVGEAPISLYATFRAGPSSRDNAAHLDAGDLRGVGSHCDGQYLFAKDVLGTNTDHLPRHSKRCRNFAAEYARLQQERIAGCGEFK